MLWIQQAHHQKRIAVFTAGLAMVLLVISGVAFAQPSEEKKGAPVEQSPKKEGIKVKYPQVVIETGLGNITVELYPDSAPKTVNNFLTLVNKKFYDGLTFHRIVKGFVIQGGDPKGDGSGNAGYTIPAEFNGRKHLKGTLAMARANDPNSASCQFYICLAPQPYLDGKYTVFGEVISGIEVVDKIGSVKTGALDRPTTPVVIKKMYEKVAAKPQQ